MINHDGIKFGKLRKKDIKKAMLFARDGMHFEWYFDEKIGLSLYTHYFWYYEISRATQVIAAYEDEKFLGVIIAEIYGEPKQKIPFAVSAYVKIFDWFSKTFFKESAGEYQLANREMLAEYSEKFSPDGEIVFLAADPECQKNGVGTMLLNELSKRENGKRVFLFTDSACTYQFYDRRGFERKAEKDIVLKMSESKKVPLKCFLYDKIL